MRIRTVKPEFWRSQDIADLDWEHRLVFIGLLSYVDDNGVGRDDFRIIAAELFALDDPLTEPSVRVQEALNVLASAGLIVRYSVSGKRFFEIPTWDRHQKINRPSAPRFPRSTHESAKIHDPLTEGSLSTQRGVGAGTGEQGNRGTGDFYSPSKSQSSSNRARVSTDAIHVPEMTRKLAARRGVSNLRSVVDAIVRHTGVTVDANGALQVALRILDKPTTAPAAPQRYVTGAIAKSPLEVQQFIHEKALEVA